jgi:hypothetical protein
MKGQIRDKIKNKKLFYKSPKIENGKATYEYFQICKGYTVSDLVNGKEILMNVRRKKCIKEKISEEIVPINNFINKEYKYIDCFKLVPTGKILRDSDFIVCEDEFCDEILYIDRKPE